MLHALQQHLPVLRARCAMRDQHVKAGKPCPPIGDAAIDTNIGAVGRLSRWCWTSAKGQHVRSGLRIAANGRRLCATYQNDGKAFVTIDDGRPPQKQRLRGQSDNRAQDARQRVRLSAQKGRASASRARQVLSIDGGARTQRVGLQNSGAGACGDACDLQCGGVLNQRAQRG